MKIDALSEPSFMKAWRGQIKRLEAETSALQKECEQHTGIIGWNNYIASSASLQLMKTLHNHLFAGTAKRLQKDWQLWFSMKVPFETMNAFVKKVRLEVLFPSYKNPGAETLLHGDLIALEDEKVVCQTQTIDTLRAADTRFTFGKPVLILHWGTDSPWAVIVPGSYWIQFGGFQYNHADGRVWSVGNAISECAMANSALSSIAEHLKVAEQFCAHYYDFGLKRNEVSRLQKQTSHLSQKLALWSQLALAPPVQERLMRQAELFEAGDPAAPHGLLLSGPPGTGKTLVASSLAQSTGCNLQHLSLADLKHSNLGASGQKVREAWTLARANQPAIIFLDECEGILGRRGAAETDVVAAELVQTFLSEWDRGVGATERVLVIGATNRRDMLDDAILSRFGIQEEIGLPAPAERERILRREMEQVFPGAVVPADMAALTQGMSGRDLRHLAAQIRTLAYPGAPLDIHFREAAHAGRKVQNTKVDAAARWETLVLNAASLKQLKLTCALLRDAESWKAQGVEVPQSLLLYGPPGTGKTQIAHTLANEGGLSFLATTTADVKANFLGQSGNRVKQLFERARTKAPVILFLDEIDIIAPIRGGARDPLTDEIVGQLLQEMDGIAVRESEVFLLGATNHLEAVDPAVLSRFRERIAIPLPDKDASRRLLIILLGSKRLGFDCEAGADALAAMVNGSGMSGRDLQGWVMRAEQKALMRALDEGGPEYFSLTLEDFQ